MEPGPAGGGKCVAAGGRGGAGDSVAGDLVAPGGIGDMGDWDAAGICDAVQRRIAADAGDGGPQGGTLDGLEKGENAGKAGKTRHGKIRWPRPSCICKCCCYLDVFWDGPEGLPATMRSLSTEKTPGTRLACMPAMVASPSLLTAPMRVTLEELVYKADLVADTRLHVRQCTRRIIRMISNPLIVAVAVRMV